MLEIEEKILLNLVQGKSPMRASFKDKRGWGTVTGTYSAAAGYQSLQVIPHVPSNPTPWRIVWFHKLIPKIDMFDWTMAHNNILTSEKLR